MTDALGLLRAAWPLVLVVALAVILIRGARGPRRHRVSVRDAQQNGAWARSEWSAGRHAAEDGGGDVGGD